MKRALTLRHAAVLAAIVLVPIVARAQAPAGRFTFVAGGDMIGPFHEIDWSDPGFRGVAALFQGADLGFANQEGAIFDLAAFPGYPAAENGGGYPVQAADAAQAIRRMGIALVSKANNHATDWGMQGLVATWLSLKAAGVTQAGTGLGEDAARAPAFVTTPMGLAALVDTASTFPPMAVAGPAVTRQGVVSHPRPGISALHVREVRLVSGAQLTTLREAMGAPTTRTGDFRIGDQVFRAAGHPGVTWEINPTDRQAVLAGVEQARAEAKFVVFSIHAHETAGDDDPQGAADYQPLVLHRADEAPSPEDPRPAAFEPRLFHDAIDAGADVVVRTGPHVLGGIEIYKGRPIFYSLGSLFFDFGGRRSFTSPGGEAMTFPDALFESVVPVSTYVGGRLTEIRLYPIAIESGPGPHSGTPRLASAERSAAILARLKTLSAAYGTRIEVEDAVGVIRVSHD